MSTLASQMWKNYMATSCSLPDYPSAVFSGIVSNAEHLRRNTYHSGIEDLPDQTGYTNFWPDDKAPPGTWARNLASAGDKSMSTADMVKEWNRYQAVYDNRNDPRRKFLSEYSGWNGRGEAERLDFQRNTRTVTSSDHKWHSHRAGRRRYANDPEFARAALSIEKGESIAQYEAGIGGTEVLRAERGMGQNGAPPHDNVLYLQRMMTHLIEGTAYAERLGEHPLAVDGNYGGGTAYWVSVLLTGGDGNLVNGDWFGRLTSMVSSKRGNEEVGAHNANSQHGGELPETVLMTLPEQTVTTVVPAQTVTAHLNP